MPAKMVTMVIKMVVLLIVIKMIVDYNFLIVMKGMVTHGETRVGWGSCPPLLAPLPPCHTTAQWLLDRRPTTSELRGFLKKSTLDFFPFEMCSFPILEFS